MSTMAGPRLPADGRYFCWYVFYAEHWWRCWLYRKKTRNITTAFAGSSWWIYWWIYVQNLRNLRTFFLLVSGNEATWGCGGSPMFARGLRPAVWWFAQQVVSKWRAWWNSACRLLLAFPWWKPWTNCRRWAMNSPIHHMALQRAETRSIFDCGCHAVSPWPILTAFSCHPGPWLGPSPAPSGIPGNIWEDGG